MSKSVLLIDTPQSCVVCPLSFYSELYSEYQCRGREKSIDNYKEQCMHIGGDDIKPDWCPLTPLPEYKDLTGYISRGDTKSITHAILYSHDQGYNDCISDIQERRNK